MNEREEKPVCNHVCLAIFCTGYRTKGMSHLCFFKRRLESPNCAYFAELKIPRNGFIDFQ